MLPAPTKASPPIGLPGSAVSSWHQETSGFNMEFWPLHWEVWLPSATCYPGNLRGWNAINWPWSLLPVPNTIFPSCLLTAVVLLISLECFPKEQVQVSHLPAHGSPFTFSLFSALYLGPSTVGYQLDLPIMKLLLPTSLKLECSHTLLGWNVCLPSQARALDILFCTFYRSSPFSTLYCAPGGLCYGLH